METTIEIKIKESLITLLHDRYNISRKFLDPENWDIPLTSKEIGMSGFMLTHLFFEIEKVYGRRFEPNTLKDYGFCTINNIVTALLSS